MDKNEDGTGNTSDGGDSQLSAFTPLGGQI